MRFLMAQWSASGSTTWTGQPVLIGKLMNYRSGVWVVAVRPNVPSAGWLRINLNQAVSTDTRAAWLVIG